MINEQLKQAKKMRSEGSTYQAIADILNVSYATAYLWLNPASREKQRVYRETHKEEIRLYHAAYRDKNKEHIRTYQVKYRTTHQEQRHINDAGYRIRHRDEIRIRGIKWRATHPTYGAEYRASHQDKIQVNGANYYRIHRNKIRVYQVSRQAIRRALVVGVTVGNQAEVKEIYRYAKEEARVRCYLCGRLIPKGHRHVDHIIPLSKGGAHRPSNLAVACDRCNQVKSDKMPEKIGLLI